MSLLDDLQLDTNLPPTWVRPSDATYNLPAGLSAHTDPDSKLRSIVRQDVFHYFTYQRAQGDLFKRDLILQQQVNLLASNLGGLTFSIPTTRVAPGKHISLPVLKGGAFAAINLKVIGCTTTGTTSSSYRMELVDLLVNQIVYTVTSVTRLVSYPSAVLFPNRDYEMRLVNGKGMAGSSLTPTTDANCGDIGGFVILSPQI